MNIFHSSGERYLFLASFVGGNASNIYIPSNFYIGLDNRSGISTEDTMETISFFGAEPSSNGYSRVAVSSINTFEVVQQGSHYVLYGPIVSFSATGGSWGPVKNIFLSTTSDNTGLLIATAELDQALTLTAGTTVNLRMGISLEGC